MKTHRKSLVVENLEKRMLLAGDVLAELSNGRLDIVGDHESNVFQVEAIVGKETRIQITPDRTTSINGQRPGVPATLIGSFDRLLAQLGAGDDVMTLNAERLRSQTIDIDTGPGSDSVRASNIDLTGAVRIVNPSGDLAFRIQDSTVGSASVISSGAASSIAVEDTQAASLYMKLGDIKGEATDRAPSSVRIIDSNIARSVRIEGEGSPLDVLIDDSSARSAYIKIATIDGESRDSSSSRVRVLDSKFAGSVDVVGANTRLDFKYDGSTAASASYYLKFDGVDGEAQDRSPSNVRILDSEVARGVRVEAEGSPLDVLIDDSSARSAYIKIATIDGESRDSSSSRVRVLDSKFAGSVDVAGANTRLDFKYDGSTAASASYYLKFDGVDGEAQDRSPSNVRILDSEVARGVRVEAEGSPLDVLIDDSSARSGYIKIGSIDGESRDSSSSRVRVLDSKFAGSVDVAGANTRLDFKFEGSTAASASYYLKFDGVDGEAQDRSPSNVRILDSEVAQGVRVEGEGSPLDVLIDDSSARSGYIKIGSIDGESRDSSSSRVRVLDSKFAGSVDVAGANTRLDFKFEGSTAASASYYLKFDGVDGEAQDRSPSSVRILDSEVARAVRIEAEGSPLDVLIEDSSARSAFIKIATIDGESRDSSSSRVRVLDSKFAGSVDVAGANTRLDFKIEGSTAASASYYLKFDGVDGEAQDRSPSSVRILDSEVARAVRIEAEGSPLDVLIEDSSVRSAFIKIATIDGESKDGVSSQRPTAATIGLVGAIIDGDLSIDSSASTRATLNRSSVGGATRVDFGSGDDDLAVRDSIFAGAVALNGGDGFDTLTLLNNRFERGLDYFGWEDIRDDGSADGGGIL